MQGADMEQLEAPYDALEMEQSKAGEELKPMQQLGEDIQALIDGHISAENLSVGEVAGVLQTVMFRYQISVYSL